MRLICPNCGAEYEVPDTVIPPSGRDVQCSNCGDTWFQQHPDHAPVEAESGADDADRQPEAQQTPPDPDPDPPAEPVPDPDAHRAQRKLDPDVADILREEAERERAARAAETAGAFETQPDLGLSDPEPTETERSRQARARMERLRGADRAARAAAADAQDAAPEHDDIDPSSRRNLLPDIEEINSSLSSEQERDRPVSVSLPEEIPEPARRGGFGSGFRLALITFVLATVVYLSAPSLAEMIPAAEGPLARYVEAVNSARLQLNDLVARLLARMGG